MGCRVAISPFLLLGLLYGANPPKPLSIQNITLSQYEDGPSAGASYHFTPGETIFFSFLVAGYRSVGDEDPKVALDYTIEARDPAKIPIVEPFTGQTEANLDIQDKNWMPKIRREISVPQSAVPGEYQILITLRDRVAVAQIHSQITFKVQARVVAPSDTLVIRDFHFYRGEDDKHPLNSAAYPAGASLWARFEITGYQFAEKNRFEVGYGLSVLRPNGEQMFRQPDAAVEKDQSFYPRRWIPAGLSLNLDKTLKPGQYTLVVLVSDKVGGKDVEIREPFSVE